MLLVQPFSQDGKIVLRAMPSGRFYTLLASFNFVPLLCKLNPTIVLFILFQVSSSCHDILVWWFLDKALMPEIQILKKLQQLNNNNHHHNLVIIMRQLKLKSSFILLSCVVKLKCRFVHFSVTLQNTIINAFYGNL